MQSDTNKPTQPVASNPTQPVANKPTQPGTSKPAHLNWILFLACMAQFMVILDVSVVNVALPAIRHGLGFTEVDLQWVVNAYTVTFAGFLLLGGRAADLIGRRRVFVSGLVLFSLASLAGGISDSRTLLIAARAIQGLGGAVIAPASLSILTTTFQEGPARNRAVGIWGAMGGGGGAAGVLLGGVITDLLSWRWILFINVPIGLLAALAAARLIPEGRDESRARDFDLRGAITATAGLSLVVLGIVRTDQTGWGSAQTLGLIAGGVALLAVFLLIEGKFAHAPLMPLRIFRSRTLSAANIVVMLVGASTFGMWFFLSLWLQQVLGYSPITAGLAFLPMTITIVIASTSASRLVAVLGAKRLLLLGLGTLALGLAWMTQIKANGSYFSEMLVPGMLAGAGMGLAFVPATITAVSGVARHEAGLASGVVNTARLFGGALGLAVLAALATSHTNGLVHAGVGEPVALTKGFGMSLWIAAALAASGALVAAFALPARPRRPPTPEPTAQAAAAATSEAIV
jgi:EmrB/QacA subfamily drug resistance transporter